MSRSTCDFRNCKGLATVVSSGNKLLCKTHGQYFASLINIQGTGSTGSTGKLSQEDVKLMESRVQDFLSKLVEVEA